MKYKFIEVNPRCLYSDESYNIRVYNGYKRETLILGTVYNSELERIKNACIEVIEINKFTNMKKVLGYYFTNEYGRYGFTIKVNKDCNYRFYAYSTI